MKNLKVKVVLFLLFTLMLSPGTQITAREIYAENLQDLVNLINWSLSQEKGNQDDALKKVELKNNDLVFYTTLNFNGEIPASLLSGKMDELKETTKNSFLETMADMLCPEYLPLLEKEKTGFQLKAKIKNPSGHFEIQIPHAEFMDYLSAHSRP